MQQKKNQFQELLLPLYFFMQLSRKAYSNYLENKLFIHACAIRKANKSIYKLLTDKPSLIPFALQDDCIALLNHYDIWFAQFDALKRKKKPQPDDTFVFQQLDQFSAFPKAAEMNIFAAYEAMKKEFSIENGIAE